MTSDFWDEVDRLCESTAHVVDRPAGSAHPRFPEWVYPLAYGDLDGTTGGDGDGIDVWFGSANGGGTYRLRLHRDPYKRDSDTK